MKDNRWLEVFGICELEWKVVDGKCISIVRISSLLCYFNVCVKMWNRKWNRKWNGKLKILY